MPITEEQAALVKGLLARGDKQHDVAAFFGVNQGRISEIANALEFWWVPPVSHRLRPATQEQLLIYQLASALKEARSDLLWTGNRQNGRIAERAISEALASFATYQQESRDVTATKHHRSGPVQKQQGMGGVWRTSRRDRAVRHVEYRRMVEPGAVAQGPGQDRKIS
jgi:hypothetical protein